MTARTRGQLEAVVWRNGAATASQVDAILQAADTYAAAVVRRTIREGSRRVARRAVADFVATRDAARRHVTADQDAAARRRQLEQALRKPRRSAA